MQVVEKALRRSMVRMQVDSLDCVQFHWWDYKDKRYLDALGHLSDLQQEGLIRTYQQWMQEPSGTLTLRTPAPTFYAMIKTQILSEPSLFYNAYFEYDKSLKFEKKTKTNNKNLKIRNLHIPKAVRRKTFGL